MRSALSTGARLLRAASPALVALLALLASDVAFAKPKLAVMDIQDQTRGLSAGLVESLTDSLRSMLARSGQFVVIDKSRQAAALKRLISAQRRESYKACYDSRCQIPLGQALAADSILRTKLTRVGSLYLLIAELVDLEKEAVTGAAQTQAAAQPAHGRDDRLLQAVVALARQLSDDTMGVGGSASGGTPPGPSLPGTAPESGPPAETAGVSRGEGGLTVAPSGESPEELRQREEQARRAQIEQARLAAEARQRGGVSVGVSAGGVSVGGTDEVRRKRASHMIYGWMALIGGGLVGATGLYYLIGKAGEERDAANQATSAEELKTHADQAKSNQVTGGVVLGLGGAAMAAGLALILTAPSVVQRPVSVAGMKLDRVPVAGVSGAQAFLVRWGGKF